MGVFSDLLKVEQYRETQANAGRGLLSFYLSVPPHREDNEDGVYLKEYLDHSFRDHYEIHDEKEVFDRARRQFVTRYGYTTRADLPIPDKEGFMLSVRSSKETEARLIEQYGALRWYFDTKEDRHRFKMELFTFRDSLDTNRTLVVDTAEGPRVKYQTVVYATVRYQGKDYILRRSYPYGHSPGTAMFDWEENNCSCDHRRLSYFDRTYPGIVNEIDREVAEGCDIRIFPIVDFRIEFEE